MLNFLLPLLLFTLFGNQEPGTIQVMSFNIRNGALNDGANSWENRKKLVNDVVKKYDCDFIGIQEGLNFQLEEILKALPDFVRAGRSREISPYEGESCPILFNRDRWELKESRTYWLSDTPEKAGSFSWGGTSPRIFTTGLFVNKLSGITLYVVNTQYDPMSSEARKESTRSIARQVISALDHKNLVIMGDLNSSESEEPVTQFLKNRNLDVVDAYRSVHSKITPSDATFFGWGPHTPDNGSRLDYIFTSRNLKVSDAVIDDYNDDGRYPSDHYPVIVELKVD